MFVWLQGNSFTRVATIYSGNITLNTPCIKYFEGVRWCLIGIDRDEKKIAIKLVTEEEMKKKTYTPDVLNKVSIGKSYVRISNKNIVKEISKVMKKDKSSGEKFVIDYNEEEKQIIIDISQSI